MNALQQQVMLQRIGEAMVVLNAETGQYYELNDSAADMLELWLRLEGRVDLIVAELSQRYAAPAAELSADLKALLRELTSAGIITAD